MRRLLEGFGLLLVLVTLTTKLAAAAPLPPENSWWRLSALPESGQGAVVALAEDPQNANHLLVGSGSGHIYSSTDAGSSWHQVAAGLGKGVLTIDFLSDRSGVVLAGARQGGIWRSQNQGESWSRLSAFSSASVRAFGGSLPWLVAASDHGLLQSSEGTQWRSLSLGESNLSAVAVSGAGKTAALLAGSDLPQSGTGTPLFLSSDGGQSWNRQSGSAVGSSMVETMLAWPSDGPSQVVMGTNAGAFISDNGGAQWNPLSGGGTLPVTDITTVGARPDQPQDFYLGSDGGGSSSGGLWVTRDGGAHFSALNPPFSSVTALTVGGGDIPPLYAATFNPQGQSGELWGYRDGGGPPTTPSSMLAPMAPSSTRSGGVAGSGGWLATLPRAPETPFLLVGLLALITLLLAWGKPSRRRINR
ncbi:MAG: WD40/YVTN/BNR-like repeat-containing protein [Candidatus Dormibacteraceae bacterium]